MSAASAKAHSNGCKMHLTPSRLGAVFASLLSTSMWAVPAHGCPAHSTRDLTRELTSSWRLPTALHGC
eukprot:4870794-Amphidinium_carterae.1